MDRKLQQRLVGTLVLACFVLLIAPVLLDADGRIPEKITNIPPQPKRPDLSHIKVVESNTPELSALQEPAEVADNPQIEFVNEAEEPAPEVVVAPQKELWSVQVASFRDAKKANEFKDVLRTGGFEVYVREKPLSDGSIFTQVFVGPTSTKAEANALKGTVKAKTGEQGLVVKYRVE